MKKNEADYTLACKGYRLAALRVQFHLKLAGAYFCFSISHIRDPYIVTETDKYFSNDF